MWYGSETRIRIRTVPKRYEPGTDTHFDLFFGILFLNVCKANLL